MDTLINESKFFDSITPLVFACVEQAGVAGVVENKAIGDYSTQLDIDVEKLIVAELNKLFPDDTILAEEGYSGTSISNQRMWLIDPICGTNNLGKGIKNFCTNIALIDEGKVIASCVLDHARNERIWSIGEGIVYVDNLPFTPPSLDMGIKIDVDFGSVRMASVENQQRHSKLVASLLQNATHDIVSLNTSLGFAYTAIGKIDGFVNVFNHPWDIAAAAFLIQQSGGFISGLDGEAWTVQSVGAIGARNLGLHEELSRLFNS